ncbi:MAG: HEAT repeat domain-containing protein [Oscillospiraceae bacterium]|nr:HEAT repeat domain-containing protein [Oscillospiraceae bacterium]
MKQRLIKDVFKKSTRIFSKLGTNCAKKRYIEQFVADNPDDYKAVMEMYMGQGYKGDELEKMTREYFGKICSDTRPKVRNIIEDRRRAKAARKEIKPETEVMDKCKCVSDLRPYINSRSTQVRKQAAYTLGRDKYDPQEAKYTLRRMVKDPMKRVRQQAKRSLDKIDRRLGAAIPPAYRTNTPLCGASTLNESCTRG